MGGRSRVSEVLNGRRALTLNMIRVLNEHLGIPLQSLVGIGAADGQTHCGPDCLRVHSVYTWKEDPCRSRSAGWATASVSRSPKMWPQNSHWTRTRR
ncbi:MAG: hypothetical protein ACYCX3_04975 [Thermoleophilia bacterium]